MCATAHSSFNPLNRFPELRDSINKTVEVIFPLLFAMKNLSMRWLSYYLSQPIHFKFVGECVWIVFRNCTFKLVIFKSVFQTIDFFGRKLKKCWKSRNFLNAIGWDWMRRHMYFTLFMSSSIDFCLNFRQTQSKPSQKWETKCTAFCVYVVCVTMF